MYAPSSRTRTKPLMTALLGLNRAKGLNFFFFCIRSLNLLFEMVDDSSALAVSAFAAGGEHIGKACKNHLRPAGHEDSRSLRDF